MKDSVDNNEPADIHTIDENEPADVRHYYESRVKCLENELARAQEKVGQLASVLEACVSARREGRHQLDEQADPSILSEHVEQPGSPRPQGSHLAPANGNDFASASVQQRRKPASKFTPGTRGFGCADRGMDPPHRRTARTANTPRRNLSPGARAKGGHDRTPGRRDRSPGGRDEFVERHSPGTSFRSRIPERSVGNATDCTMADTNRSARLSSPSYRKDGWKSHLYTPQQSKLLDPVDAKDPATGMQYGKALRSSDSFSVKTSAPPASWSKSRPSSPPAAAPITPQMMRRCNSTAVPPSLYSTAVRAAAERVQPATSSTSPADLPSTDGADATGSPQRQGLRSVPSAPVLRSSPQMVGAPQTAAPSVAPLTPPMVMASLQSARSTLTRPSPSSPRGHMDAASPVKLAPALAAYLNSTAAMSRGSIGSVSRASVGAASIASTIGISRASLAGYATPSTMVSQSLFGSMVVPASATTSFASQQLSSTLL